MRASAVAIVAILLIGPSSAPAQEQPQGQTAEQPPPARSAPMRGATPVRDAWSALAERHELAVVFDPRLGEHPVSSLPLAGVPLDEALARLEAATGTFAVRQPDGTLVVAEDTPQNRRAYEPLEIVALPVRHHSLQEVDKALRSLIEARRLATDSAASTLLLRDSAAKLRIAERLVTYLDQPPAEVDVAVEVIEVASADLPPCGEDPGACGRTGSRTARRRGEVRWSGVLTVVGESSARQETVVHLEEGARLHLELELTARHLPALDRVEVAEQHTASQVVVTGDGRQNTASAAGRNTSRLAPGETQVLRLADAAPGRALLVLLTPLVRRPDPWTSGSGLKLPVGTESRIAAPRPAPGGGS